ncbi:hypothetical protein PENSPDRAFT_737772 [Peniophora sp. CONT]|nr:hypothetical protein PENSPDRAFT_737772 [Peniophora sp. CONT]
MFPISCNAFGDIATMITIAYTIAQALDDARGSADEYRAFAYVLRAFGELLEEIKELHASASDDAVSPRVLVGINGCCEVLEDARLKVARYGGLEDAHEKTSLRRVVLKLRWRLLKRDEVERLRVKLLSRMEILLGYIDRKEFAHLNSRLVEISERSSVVEATIDVLKNNVHHVLETSSAMMRKTSAFSNDLLFETAAIRAELNALSKVLNDGFQRITRNARNEAPNLALAGPEVPPMPSALTVAVVVSGGFALRSDFKLLVFYGVLIVFLHNVYKTNRLLPPAVDIPRSNCVLLIDVLGARISLPMELCSTLDDFHETLLRLFNGKRGQMFVQLRAYEIMTAGDHLPIYSESWFQDVQPGSELVMGAVVRRKEPSEMTVAASRALAPVCPRCKASLGVNAPGNSEFTLCRACQGQISIRTASASDETVSQSGSSLDQGQGESDIPFLRMIRVLYSKVHLSRREQPATVLQAQPVSGGPLFCKIDPSYNEIMELRRRPRGPAPPRPNAVPLDRSRRWGGRW